MIRSSNAPTVVAASLLLPLATEPAMIETGTSALAWRWRSFCSRCCGPGGPSGAAGLLLGERLARSRWWSVSRDAALAAGCERPSVAIEDQDHIRGGGFVDDRASLDASTTCEELAGDGISN